MNILQVTILSIAIISINGYFQFQLIRNPHRTKRLPLIKSECQDPKTIDSQAQYLELCYQKDIAYTFQFQRNSKHYLLGLDLTTPISWIKDDKCKITQSNQKCSLIKSSFNQRIKGMVSQKITSLMSKMKLKIAEDDSHNNAIIQGSNQIVMGEVQTLQNLSIITHNSGHLNNFFDLMLLGLFIIGQNDNFTLKNTTFISVHQITGNLNAIEDGAVSLRFDQNSQNSFLNQAFNFLKAQQKIISVYLSKNKNIVTIGGMTAKYTQTGISSFTRLKIQQDDKYGKLPKLQAIIVQNQNIDDNTLQVQSNVLFSLSASYIAFPKSIISSIIDKFLKKPFTCKINGQNYLQCSCPDQDLIDSILTSSLNIDFDTSIISLQINKLVMHSQHKKIVFNIKQTVHQYSIIGQPFFLSHYVYFDYGKNQIGVAPRKQTMQEHFIEAITLIHFVFIIMLFGFCLFLSSGPTKKFYFSVFQQITNKLQTSVIKGFRPYQPIEHEQRQYQIPSKHTKMPNHFEGEQVQGI